MSYPGSVIVILYLTMTALIIFLVYYYIPDRYINSAITIVLVVFTSIGAVLLSSFKEQLTSYVHTISAKRSLYRICLFGRSGTGKTTLMENSFTFMPTKNIDSTDNFDYFDIRMPLTMRESRDICIADYKGQNPSQVILYGDPKFFGYDNIRLLNSVFFIVDLVPKRFDEQNNVLSDEDLIQWIISKNALEIIEERIKENYDYINEAIIELIFAKFYSRKNLKSVRLLITKVDLVNRLNNDGHITLSNFKNAEKYAEYKYRKMIENIECACSKLRIKDFSYHPICANRSDDLRPIFSSLSGLGN